MRGEAYRALYIHVPFCVRRCAYCDFHTRAASDDDPALDACVASLLDGVSRASSAGELSHVETVYIGGGTPTFLGAARLGLLLGGIGAALDRARLSEFTVEGNPDSLSPEVLEALAVHGVSRLSIGVQSLDDAVLATLGRVHDAADALRAARIACKVVGNVSADVICGVPGQSDESVGDTVATLVDAGVSHISVYPLAVEEGTPIDRAIGRGELPDVDEDVQARHMQLVAELLGNAGFARYEVASYARPGFESRHNTAYWTGVPYLGIGDGAASMRNLPDGGRIRESRAGEVVEREELDAREAACEDAMLAMRMVRGISRERLSSLVARAPSLQQAVDEVVHLGLARWTDCSLVPTERGWLMGNELYGRLWAAARKS